MEKIRSTTILVVRKNGQVAMAGDGQVTLGPNVMKSTATKVRAIGRGTVLAGFAGSTADAVSLLDMFDEKLEKYSRNLGRAAVELAREWRTDKILRRLEAMILVADIEKTFLISGQGDVIEPDDAVCSIGSGSVAAQAAATALLANTELTVEEIVKKSMQVASSICIYTNNNITLMKLGEEA
jgi:ATP-dependent HslUV protease subunit HslV